MASATIDTSKRMEREFSRTDAESYTSPTCSIIQEMSDLSNASSNTNYLRKSVSFSERNTNTSLVSIRSNFEGPKGGVIHETKKLNLNPNGDDDNGKSSSKLLGRLPEKAKQRNMLELGSTKNLISS